MKYVSARSLLFVFNLSLIHISVIFDEKGKLLTGGDVSSTVALLEGLGVDVLGINCGLGPVQMKGIVEAVSYTHLVPGSVHFRGCGSD